MISKYIRCVQDITIVVVIHKVVGLAYKLLLLSTQASLQQILQYILSLLLVQVFKLLKFNIYASVYRSRL